MSILLPPVVLRWFRCETCWESIWQTVALLQSSPVKKVLWLRKQSEILFSLQAQLKGKYIISYSRWSRGGPRLQAQDRQSSSSISLWFSWLPSTFWCWLVPHTDLSHGHKVAASRPTREATTLPEKHRTKSFHSVCQIKLRTQPTLELGTIPWGVMLWRWAQAEVRRQSPARRRMYINNPWLRHAIRIHPRSWEWSSFLWVICVELCLLSNWGCVRKEEVGKRLLCLGSPQHLVHAAWWRAHLQVAWYILQSQHGEEAKSPLPPLPIWLALFTWCFFKIKEGSVG